MRFTRNQTRPNPPARVRGPVFAIGQRVAVKASGAFPPRVTLMDESGATACANLADGTEVEIRAWRPGGSRGTGYYVRSTESGIEGWLAVASLYDPESTSSAAEAGTASSRTIRVAPHAQEPADTGRRFGQR